MARILVDGGCGFIGSSVAEHLMKKHEIVIFDSFIRDGSERNIIKDLEVIRGDIRFEHDFDKIGKVDGIYHAAANPGIKWSFQYPIFDFETNAKGTLNILEFARKNHCPLIYCSSNKVYDGTKINAIPTIERETRYEYADPNFKGISETFGVDGNNHSMYGVSKLSGDLLCQEYAKNMGVPTIVNRMSCIGGTRQMGVEDQGWFAWFVIAALKGLPLNMYGNGKQVRDVLSGNDLAKLVDIEFEHLFNGGESDVFNVGGGLNNSMSLLECINYIESKLDVKMPLYFHDWRLADHRIYISDIRKVMDIMSWKPETKPEKLLDQIIEWNKEREYE